MAESSGKRKRKRLSLRCNIQQLEEEDEDHINKGSATEKRLADSTVFLLQV